MDKKKIKIGIAGSRGIPSAYGGFETFAEMLSIDLIQVFIVDVTCEINALI